MDGDEQQHVAAPDSSATALWAECTRCGRWWLVPRCDADELERYVGPCCIDYPRSSS